MLTSIALTTLLAASGGIAHAARSDFAGRVPRVGSRTYPSNYTVTTQNGGNIDVEMETNPREIAIKPVTCDTESDISGYRIIDADDHGETALATKVKPGTCFKLNINARTVDYFHVEGTLTH